jgi:hypothetical protein
LLSFKIFNTFFVLKISDATVGTCNNKTKLVKSFNFIIPYDQFSTLVNNRKKRGLASGWTNVFYNKFHEVMPSCALTFKDNWFRNVNSRHINVPFWSARAVCKTGKTCVEVSMNIQSQPECNVDVPVTVILSGVCQHVGGKYDTCHDEGSNTRRLSGVERENKVYEIKTTCRSPAESYYRKLSQMTDTECKAGNLTACQTASVLKQAVYEAKLKSILHEDITNEVDIQRQDFEACVLGSKFNGFIQSIGKFPFHVQFFSEKQLVAYVTACKREDGCVVHFDATGSVVCALPGQRKPLYYCFLMEDNSLPVMEFITCSQKSSFIQWQLENFNSFVRLVNNNRLVKPACVVTDQSMALINACLRAFNEMTLASYLNKCLDILERKCTVNEIRSVTIHVLCNAHMIKNVSSRLARVERNKHKRKAVLVMFAMLARAVNLEAAKRIYQLIHTVLCTPHETEDVAKARKALQTLQLEEDSTNAMYVCSEPMERESFEEGIVHDCSGDITETIQQQSSFRQIFSECLSNVEFDDSAVSNANRSLTVDGFKVIESEINLFPMWSASLQKNAFRFGSDYNDNFIVESVVCKSNAAVESHFKGVKHGRFDERLPIRPRKFITGEYTFIMGKMKECEIPCRNAKKRLSLSDCQETWRKRRKGANYSSPLTVDKILRRFGNHNYQFEEIKSYAINAEFSDVEGLTDIEIGRGMDILRQMYQHVDGLQSPVYGQYTPGSTLPHFAAAERRFVQVFHLPEHWVCGTNVFSTECNEVYWFDSLPKDFVIDSAIVQLTSILRLDSNTDNISLRIRKCDEQPYGTSLCGYYALAAAAAICAGQDPTQMRYEAKELVSSIRSGLSIGILTPVKGQHVQLDCEDIAAKQYTKKHCLCNSASSQTMVVCYECKNRFHVSCVDFSDDDVDISKMQWIGPCCSSKLYQQQQEIDLTIDRQQ